ncbi:hypothetical protein ABEB36_000417 [Hypothenemus hampei]|uniref:Uncharacterized protein n=1 Tax=Hypothenemus hampei TaxID=57062 RepID=A0ABD1FB68_HYPHA
MKKTKPSSGLPQHSMLKVVATQRNHVKGTGGGAPIDHTSDPVVEVVLKIINMKTVVGLENFLIILILHDENEENTPSCSYTQVESIIPPCTEANEETNETQLCISTLASASETTTAYLKVCLLN